MPQPCATHARALPPGSRPRRLAVAAVVCVAALSLSGCTDRPDLTGRVTPAQATGPWPSLVPLSTLALETGADIGTQTAATEALAARAAALAARAAALSARPVLTNTERQRLQAAVNRNAAR